MRHDSDVLKSAFIENEKLTAQSLRDLVDSFQGAFQDVVLEGHSLKFKGLDNVTLGSVSLPIQEEPPHSVVLEGMALKFKDVEGHDLYQVNMSPLLTNLTTQVGSLSNHVNRLETDVITLEIKVDDLESTFDDHEDRITALELGEATSQELAELAGKVQIISESVDDLESQADDLESRVEVLEAKPDFDPSAINSRLTTAESNITSQDTRITAVETLDTAQNSRLTNLEAEDVSIKNRVSEVETLTGQHTTSIANKASLSDVKTWLNDSTEPKRSNGNWAHNGDFGLYGTTFEFDGTNVAFNGRGFNVDMDYMQQNLNSDYNITANGIHFEAPDVNFIANNVTGLSKWTKIYDGIPTITAQTNNAGSGNITLNIGSALSQAYNARRKIHFSALLANSLGQVGVSGFIEPLPNDVITNGAEPQALCFGNSVQGYEPNAMFFIKCTGSSIFVFWYVFNGSTLTPFTVNQCKISATNQIY